MATGDLGTLDIAAKVLGMCAAVSLGASLIYDWGFFFALGLSFSDVPTSIADHARSALDWLPWISAVFLPAFVYEVLTRRIEEGKTEDEIIEGSPNPARTRKLRTGSDRFQVYGAVALLALIVLIGEIQPYLTGILLTFMWLIFSGWAQNHPRIMERRSRSVRLAIVFLPAAAAFFWFNGRADAVKAYRASPSTKIYFVGAKNSIDASIIRFLDKGVLFKDKETGLAYRQWSMVDRIDMQASFKPFTGILCSWFRAGCIDWTQNPPKVMLR